MWLWLLCGWKLIPMNTAYNDAIEGRTWNDLYALYNGKVCSKFGLYPIRENNQDYVEWYCLETIGTWVGDLNIEPNITTPQYNETRFQELEQRVAVLELPVRSPSPSPIPALKSIQQYNETRMILLEEMVQELLEQNKYLLQRIQAVESNPYGRSNMNPIQLITKE